MSYQVGDRLVYTQAVCPANQPRVGQKATVLTVDRGYIRVRWDDGSEEGKISTGFEPLNSGTEIKRGGKRSGAGRKRGEASTRIRVPESQVDACQEYVKFSFTSDQVRWAYSQCQIEACSLNIPGVPVPLLKVYQYGFRWLGDFKYFRDSVIAMSESREDMEVIQALELSIKFDW